MNPDYAIRADSADCYESEMIIYTLAYPLASGVARDHCGWLCQ